jgi:Rne/Rng family ribonuclease
MSKELFVSTTPHETKVGMVEDDLLAEIYLERENEYTLAGSIYKGRVTRVLPGMQSAFVDIGLERDAFLYVSDFMELEEGDDVDDIPTNRPVTENASERQSQPASTDAVLQYAEPGFASTESSEGSVHSGESRGPSNGREQQEGDGRGRRRRRGRRGERMPDSKFARPVSEAPAEAAAPVEQVDRPEQTERPGRSERPERSGRPDRGGRFSRPERNDRSGNDRSERSQRTDQSDDYGPPPGYQPILLPGESISKYSRLAQNPPAPQRSFPSPSSTPPAARGTFLEDEPLFADSAEALAQTADTLEEARVEAPSTVPYQVHIDSAGSEWDREQKRQHELNVASVFGTATEEAQEQPAAGSPHSDLIPVAASAEGTLEEEEIDEEESEEEDADLAHYVEELEEDAPFEELEEETHSAGDHDADDHHEHHTHEIAAVGEPVVETIETVAADSFSAERPDGVEVIEGVDAATGQEHEDAEAEDELEEAQAQAEALLDAEARGNGTVDAQVEVRAPETTAAFTQRAPRPGFDPRRSNNQRGRRGGGGRRFPRREPQNLPQITDLLKEGQEILVQIAKEPIGKKGARITSHIALPGRFLVYMPTVNHTGVSRKIASEEERQRLKRIIISERENGHGGFIVRTAAQGAAEEELRADIRFLKGLWNEIKTRAETGKSPALIYHDLNVVERILRDQVTSDFSAVWVDTEQEYERILRFATRFQPALVRRVKLYSKEVPLFEQFGLSEEINKALKSKVWLKSGGYIVINQTEALVAIDVNTGKYVGKTARLEDTIVKTNVDAIKEIVRQIRLRDLGGIIIIDFIDMDERRNRQKVMQALEEALKSDRAPSKVLQFNDFGLVAITRKRVKQSLERTIGSPCPYCDSTGYVKSVTTICNDIYIEMRKMAKHLDHADVMLRVNPEVGKALKANNGKALTEMEELTKKTVIVKSDPALHQEQFDIN